MRESKEDIIKKFFIVKGPELDYLAALFLEKGTIPRVVCRARLKDGKTIYAYGTGSSLGCLEEITLRNSEFIAKEYGYDLITVPLPDHFTDTRLLAALRETKKEMANWYTIGGLN